MHTLCSFAAIAICAVGVTAQSPLCTIQPFASNNGGSSGGIVYFDLQVNAGSAITAIDVNFGATAGTPVGIQVYTVPSTFVGNENNAGAWTLVGQDNGTTTSAGLNGVTAFTLQSPIILPPGNYGVAYVAVNSTHRYTNGTGSNHIFSTAEMTLTAGAAQNVPWTGTPFVTRVVNTCIHYSSAAGFAAAIPYGQGCTIDLVSVARPVVNTTGTVRTANIPAGTTNGFMLIGFSRTPAPGIALGMIGAPGCFAHTSGDLALPLSPSGATDDFSLPIPNNPSLAGVSIYLQSAVVAAGANPLGLLTSNGMQWTVDVN